jgi:hypothetical protein
MAVTLTSVTINSAGTQATVVFTESPGTFGTLNTPTAANFVLGVDYTNAAEQEYYAPVAGTSIASVTGNGTNTATVVVNLASVVPAMANAANANQEIFRCVATAPAAWLTDGTLNSPTVTNAATTNNSTTYAVAGIWTRWHLSPRERFSSPVRLGVLAFCDDGIDSVQFINAATGSVIATATDRTLNPDCPGLDGRFVYDYNFTFNPADFSDGLVNIRARINPTGTNYAARHLNADIYANSGGTLVNSGRTFHIDSSHRVPGSGTGNFTQWEFARSSAGPVVFAIRTASGNLHFSYQETAVTHSVALSSVVGTPTYGQLVRITGSFARHGRVLSYSGGTLVYVLDRGSNFANTETLQFVNEHDSTTTTQATATVNGTPTAVTGTIGSGETITGLLSGATWVTSSTPTANGVDSVGTAGTSGDPFASVEYAIDRCVTLHTTAAGLTVSLIQGRHKIASNNASATTTSAITFVPFDSSGNARLVPSTSTTANRMAGTVVQGPFVYDARTIFSNPWDTGLFYDVNSVANKRAWLDNVTVLAVAAGFSTANSVVNSVPTSFFLTLSRITQRSGHDAFTSGGASRLVRGCNIYDIGADSYGNGSVIDSTCSGMLLVSGAHPDVWQWFKSGTARDTQCDNIILYGITGYNNDTQGLFMGGTGGNNELWSFWMSNCVLEKTGLSTQFSQIGRTVRNFHVQHVTTNQSLIFVSTDTHTATRSSMRRCAFADLQVTAGAVKATLEAAWTFDDNNFVTGGTWGTNGTTGAAGYVNEAARDYSPGVGSVLLNRYTAGNDERDVFNRLLSSDAGAKASIGAVQPTGTLTATVDGNAIVSGGSAAASGVSGGSTTLVFTIGGPTGAVLVVDAGSVGGGLSAMVPPTLPRTLTSGGTTTTATFTATLGSSPGTFNVGTDALADFTGTVTWASGSDFPFRARMGGSFRNPTGGIRRR